MTLTREEVERLLSAIDALRMGEKWQDARDLSVANFDNVCVALLTTMAKLDEAEAEAHGWKLQLGKIAALVPISQIVRVTGTTKDLIEWLTDRVAAASRAEAAEAERARLAAANAQLEARVAGLAGFVTDFAAAKIDALRFPGVIRSPEDEPDPVVDATEVWAWQEDARTAHGKEPT